MLKERIENTVAAVGCSFEAFIVAFLVVITWAATGPYFGYSDTWQLVINTGTTIITFLMAFLIGANQRRADVGQSEMSELMERHVQLIENHTAAWEKHQHETHRLLCEVHSLMTTERLLRDFARIENEKLDRLITDLTEIKTGLVQSNASKPSVSASLMITPPTTPSGRVRPRISKPVISVRIAQIEVTRSQTSLRGR